MAVTGKGAFSAPQRERLTAATACSGRVNSTWGGDCRFSRDLTADSIHGSQISSTRYWWLGANNRTSLRRRLRITSK